MDLLSNIRVFIAITEQNSLGKAAYKLNISPSSASKQISSLEDYLGVRLLNRTTRRISLTDIGEAYLDKAIRIVDAFEDSEILVNASQNNPRGLLRIASPQGFGTRHISPHLPYFMNQFPELRVELITYEGNIDIIKESIDVAIKFTELEDSTLIGKKIAPGRRTIVASPSYIKDRGKPKNPEDLLNHRLVTYRGRSVYNDWHFLIEKQPFTMRVNGNLSMTNGEHILRAAINGGGIAMLSGYITGRQIRDGRLVSLLDEYVVEQDPIYAVYPSKKNLSPKIKTFIDYLIKLYSPNPYWESGDKVNLTARNRSLI